MPGTLEDAKLCLQDGDCIQVKLSYSYADRIEGSTILVTAGKGSQAKPFEITIVKATNKRLDYKDSKGKDFSALYDKDKRVYRKTETGRGLHHVVYIK
jgi:hypothetical protein